MIAMLGHTERMEAHWLTKKIVEWKPTAFRPTQRHKMKWEDNVKQNLTGMKIYHGKSKLEV
jgi:hypothetical protein